MLTLRRMLLQVWWKILANILHLWCRLRGHDWWYTGMDGWWECDRCYEIERSGGVRPRP